MFLNPWYARQPGTGKADATHPDASGQPNVADLQARLDKVQESLEPGWTVHLLRDGRYFYCNHASQTSSWIPPTTNWEENGTSLPYGWESATDKDGKQYFINHLNKTTTYEDPRRDLLEEPPVPRDVDLIRDPEMGFGFVAGSEKPVIVRFVTDGGPSVDKLMPGDQILVINGEDVKKAPRDHVIQLVRSCKEKVSLKVCQPPLDNSARKSALLSAAKKQRLKSNPSRVRFAESVDINGISSSTPSHIGSSESTTPFMPNVLKVFLENGQTKSFKYDSSTTVDDVLNSLHQKLAIKKQEHFSLVVEHVKSLKRNKLTLLNPNETLSTIAARPGAQMLRCLYRITFVPADAYEFLRQDAIAFEYLYLQCCNDVIQERFSPELKYEMALRLAALHIHQHALSAGSSSKLSVKNIEKEFGLERFVPSSLVESMKRKELRKVLSHFLKLHGSGPGQKPLTALQAKLQYMKIVSELPSYGAKCFSTYNSDGSTESVVLISPKFGISQINGIGAMPESLCEIEQMTVINVNAESDLTKKVEITIKDPDKENLLFNLEDHDADEMMLVLQGYHKLLADKPMDVIRTEDRHRISIAPPYHAQHKVDTSKWNYIIIDNDKPKPEFSQRIADFSLVPPYQRPPEGFQIPNGDIHGVESSNRRNIFLDSNMNRTASVYDNDGTIQASPQIVPKEVKVDDIKKKKIEYPEARNDEVIKRVAEMHQMVEDAENYLSDAECETTDVESVRSEAYGKLKHSDSLLLLTQGQKMLPTMGFEGDDHSGSDTDSQSTPIPSPAHKPVPEMKTSGSSFGLHSPDNLPLPKNEEGIKNLRDQIESNDGYPPEESLYLDPDIIDLTMLPPPVTPEEEGAKLFPPQVNTPPTPFADKESLEKELEALERNKRDVRTFSGSTWNNTSTSSDPDDSMSISSFSTSSTLTGYKGQPFTLAALKQLGFKEGEDIDAFISNLTIPPPPEGATDSEAYAIRKNIKGEYDISAFIIPPPPSINANQNRSSDIIRRLYAAKKDISEVVGGQIYTQPMERDNIIDEVRVYTDQVEKQTVPSGRVASLQKRFESSNLLLFNDGQGSKNGTPTHSSKNMSPVSQNNLSNFEMRQFGSTGTKSLKRPENLKEYNLGENGTKSLRRPDNKNSIPILQRDSDHKVNCIITSVPSNSLPRRPVTLQKEEVTPPPPRYPRQDHSLMNQRNSSPQTIKVFSPRQAIEIKKNTQSPDSPSSFGSNDSLASSSSASTVKSISPINAPEKPPQLPPRPKAQLNSDINNGILKSRSPSPSRNNEIPPAIPSRIKKPQSGQDTINRSPLRSQPKPAAPQPPNGMIIDEKPRLPAKSSQKLTQNGFDRPLKTSSPKPTKLKINGILDDPNDSIDSGSFDQDSLEEIEDIDAMAPVSREAYRYTAAIISESIKRLTDYIKKCKDSDADDRNEYAFTRSKEILASESRQFVTASKLFVKSATESEELLLSSLTNSIKILQKMVNICQELVLVTTTPDQTLMVVTKVRDVVSIYIKTVRAALMANGRDMDHPSMNTLMKQATSLAGALTALMRTLKVFSP